MSSVLRTSILGNSLAFAAIVSLLLMSNATNAAAALCLLESRTKLKLVAESQMICNAKQGAVLPASEGKLKPLAQKKTAQAFYQVAQELADRPQHAKLSVAWYKLAADRNYVPALYALALQYEIGELVEKDLASAHQLYSRALNAGSLPEILSVTDLGEAAKVDVQPDVAAIRQQLQQSKNELARRQQSQATLAKELKAASDNRPVGDALSFSIMAQKQRVKRAKKKHQTVLAGAPRQAIAQAVTELNSGKLSAPLTLLEADTKSQFDQLTLAQDELQEQEMRLASIRADRAPSGGSVNAAVMAMDSTQAKDNALKGYLADLESSVQHSRVSQKREKKKLAFLQKRIDRLKKQNVRKVKRDDQVLLERALSEMDTRYQGQIGYLADNLQQEMKHAESLKGELQVVEAQAKNSRKLVATITKRLDAAADLVDRQSALVDKQSKDLRLAIDSMNEAHSKPIKNDAQLWEPKTLQPAQFIEPEITLKWPEFSIEGDEWVVQVDAGKPARLVGALMGQESIESFRVNGVATEVDKNGLFMASIDVFDKPAQVLLEGRAVQGDTLIRKLRLEPQQPKIQRYTKPAMLSASTLEEIEFGQYHALIFGNNQYGTGGFETLDTAVNDAESLGALLESQYGFETEVVLNATRDEMITAMEAMRKKLTDADNLLIYYAGHGIIDPESNEGYWVPVDGAIDSTKRWIANATITNQIRAMTARNIMVISDSCYSGSLMRSGMMYVRSGLTPEKKIKRVSEDVIAATRVVLSSGGLQPVIDSIDGNPNSVFTSAMLEKLRNNQDLLDADSLATNVSHAVAMATADTVKQVPRFAPLIRAGHEGGEFYFVPKTWRKSVEKAAQGE